MDRQEIKSELQSFFRTQSDYVPGDEENLFESGALDSFGVVEFLTYIENHLNKQIDLEDITMENFSTIQKISDLLMR